MLIECIPNFSEGRDARVIDAIAAAIRAVDGVTLLDVSADHDHNRAVMTFVGDAPAVEQAAFAGIAVAAERIDLTAHHGEHPRIGAADVVPFVPLRGATMADCVGVARRLGARVGAELGLPVYLYEEAATRPERRNLADVRRPRYEGLRECIADDPAWVPDYGAARMGKAGAVAIGARPPLIAFNVYLDTDDASIAQAIAEKIRASGGGLPALKALGLRVAGQAQVSMNVIDFRRTGLHAIMQAIHAEAAAHGVRVTHSEIVGLVPRRALLSAALESLQLPPETHALILEERIGNMMGDFQEIGFE